MPFQSSRLLALLLAGVLLSGCGSSGKVAAVVNGRVITVKHLESRLSSMNPSARASFSNQKGRLLDQMIVESILLQEAEKRGLDRDAEVRRLLQEAQKQILVGRLLEVLRKEKENPVADEQVAQFYEANKSNFMQPESYRASHILTADEATAKKAIDRIKAGELFAKVAEELSTDPSKSHGGDIGFFAKGQVIPEFEEACLKLKPGEMSGVVKTPLGYHIILLAEQKASHQRPLEEVRDQIQQVLQNQQGQQAVQGIVQELRSKAQVKIRENFNSPVPAIRGEQPVAPSKQ